MRIEGTRGSVVIVGAGHAGGTLAMELRAAGHDGPVTIVGDEPHVPYQRPPLSKAFLKGGLPEEKLELRPRSWYATHDVDLRLGAPVEAIDREERRLRLGDGATLAYDRLVLATGVRPARLAVPGADLAGVHYLRGIADARRLAADLGAAGRLVVVGAGFTGLEVAASAAALGCGVTLVVRGDKVLSRVASAPVAAFLRARHEAAGVVFRFGSDVETFLGDGDRVFGVRLGDGEILPCDRALVAVGADANDALARRAGLACDGGGIVVDESGRTSDPAIFAIGDVSVRPLPYLGGRLVRLESVHNALEQARIAAAVIAGTPPPRLEPPWFWSDQYDLKLQTVGLVAEADDLVLRGEPETGRFAVFHLAGDRLRAVEAINAPLDFAIGKQLVAKGAPISRGALADPSVDIRAVAAAH
jgi:3-phenylpropionate/trans-cinnamate dioxygenase ferredoxin reductase subunit